MRFLIIILSLYATTLSVVPCCPADNCDDEVETTHTDNHNQPHEQEEFNSCSQFLSCGNCSGFVIMYGEPQIACEMIEFSNLSSPSCSIDEFIPNIWQPPQLG